MNAFSLEVSHVAAKSYPWIIKTQIKSELCLRSAFSKVCIYMHIVMGEEHCFLQLPDPMLLGETMPHIPLLCISGMYVIQAVLLVPGEGLNHYTFVNPSFILTRGGAC